MSIIATDLDGTIFKGQTLIDGVKEGLLKIINEGIEIYYTCLLYTSPSPRDGLLSRMPSSA